MKYPVLPGLTPDGTVYENPAMGIYFISDPDGYWIEIVPEKK